MVNLIPVNCEDDWHELEPGEPGTRSECPTCGMVEIVHARRAEYINGNKVLL